MLWIIEVVLYNLQGIQTDPQMDPFGAWSKRGYQSLGNTWKPPAPPSTWMEFDPTAPSLPADGMPGSAEGVALRQAMLGGVQPAEIRQEAMECANLVQREVHLLCPVHETAFHEIGYNFVHEKDNYCYGCLKWATACMEVHFSCIGV